MVQRDQETREFLQHILDETSLLQLGQEAIQLLKAFKVDKSFRLSSEALKLAALLTVQNIAAKRRDWITVDSTLASIRNEPVDKHERADEKLSTTTAVYQDAAEVHQQRVKPREVFAARDAAQRFAGGYWRYTPESNTVQGKLFISNLRRAGARFRPIGSIALGIESHLPKGVQTFLAIRRAS